MLLEAARRNKVKDEFIWVASESFDVRAYKDLEEEAKGAFYLSPNLPADNFHPYQRWVLLYY